MATLGQWTRRGFLATAGLVGGGLALGIVLAPNRLKMTDAAPEGQVVLNTWVRVAPDNTVTVIFPHSEMGQGVGTGLAQMLAEEMEADWAQIRIEQAPPTEAYINSDLGRGYILGDAAIPGFMNRFIDYSFLQIARFAVGQLTGGSTAIRLTGHYAMRRAGAAAKGMLIQAAAEAWGVDASAIRAEAGRVVGPDGQSATFGELAGAAAAFTPDLAPPLKDPKDYRIVGQPVTRLDLPAKVNGTAVFGMDVTMPGMGYAAVMLPPVMGARVGAVDESGVTARPGLGRVLNLGDAVAVLADSYWTASRALEELAITWEGGRTDLSSAAIATEQETALAGAPEWMIEAGTVGELPVTASYSVPYLAHATMEPMNATVHVRTDGAEVWIGHQNMAFARAAVADHLGLSPDQVVINPTYLGGGFGRRGQMDALILAVRIAVEAGTPVKTIWSRETDMTHDWYRPAVQARLAGAVENGRMTAFRHVYTHT
ncbi:molybdopterin cofactor-binding domain-containing protein, partial [Tabrizicola sp.]|uniref:molybdopterin cofactor-binding domain-containing protein n=1 Tax=Tabrizicola sp. TaxID=2005166 RepID=UPI003F3926B1